MPITLHIGPIILDKETSDEADELIEAGRATFCVGFRELDIDGVGVD